jgi:transcriptional regulator with PAS, ATPase and Fis domain
MIASLVAVAGPIKGDVVPLTGEPLSIGRSTCNQLSIPDVALSRTHCRVRSESNQAIIHDLESSNGTFVNGIPVRRRVLEHGDEVRVGQSVFVFVLSDAAMEASMLPAKASNTDTETIQLPPCELRKQVENEHGSTDPHAQPVRSIHHEMVGESRRMVEVYEIIARAAPSESTVLIHGESGTGKELAAQAIHLNSPRSRGPFVAINCAALTDTLLESELFGHEKGAFTGAIGLKKGRIEMADGGTIFFDEIGELAQSLQAKLLRVLQQRQFERVGGTRPLNADIRVVAATNKNLEETVKKGEFREDLYYRLNVVTVTMPPLRERRDDIPLLTAHFVSKHAARCKRRVLGVSTEVRSHLIKYDWPGNVRELENAIERAIVLGNADRILLEDLPEAVLEADPAGDVTSGYHAALREAKRRIVLHAMQEAGGRHTEAARALGLHPNNLHRMIRSLNIREELRK